MVLNYNDTQAKDVINNLIDGLKLNPVTDSIPHAVIPTIQPTFEVKRRVCNIVEGNAGASSGSAVTIYTTPSDKDFYLVGANLTMSKDAACDTTTGSLQLSATINGTVKNILRMSHTTLTALQGNVSISLPVPIKIDRNTAITIITLSFTAGTFSRGANIIGYTEEAGNNLSV